MAQVLINDDNLFGRPAERDGALPQGILARRAFRILEDLLKRTLPDIQTRQALEMARSNLLGHHCGTSRSVSSMSCSRRVSICRSVNRRIARPAASTTKGSEGARFVQAVGRERMRPVAGSWKNTRGSPQASRWAMRGNCCPERGWKGWVTVKLRSPSVS